jgi:hypothetical protein
MRGAGLVGFFGRTTHRCWRLPSSAGEVRAHIDFVRGRLWASSSGLVAISPELDGDRLCAVIFPATQHLVASGVETAVKPSSRF